MNENRHSPDCERASDLIAFLYDEAGEHEQRDFELHLKVCRVCRKEVASFGVVRQSITTWRDEVLSGFAATPLPSQRQKRSAMAAIRQFLDLSPLWLKGAISFAVLTLALLATLGIVRLQTGKTQMATSETNKDQFYTAQDVERMVKEALAKEPPVEQTDQRPENIKVVAPRKPKPTRPVSQMAKRRRPLTRAEREQLAADLRLLTTGNDEVELHLLADQINQ
jgi:hypothetical protein